ncbi:hypothetical protein C8034_v008956 [Colletotrichum sidae]|uniref:Uncharacterized protein n=1 Tax=Colletotrichum sidae TaxID=1347389 RepID=A0A4R8TP80_9PEZI|nr:hypothetical protein C8034_v008956 [Colletotrichum sidae]
MALRAPADGSLALTTSSIVGPAEDAVGQREGRPIPPRYYINEAQFRSYNPTLTTTFNLIIGNSYCVERNWGIPPPVTMTSSAAPTTSAGNGVQTPTPTQSGMVASSHINPSRHDYKLPDPLLRQGR